MGNLAGEAESGRLRLDFDTHLRLEFRGARVISHSRRTIFQMAEVAVPGELFAELLTRIRRLAAVPT